LSFTHQLSVILLYCHFWKWCCIAKHNRPNLYPLLHNSKTSVSCCVWNDVSVCQLISFDMRPLTSSHKCHMNIQL
jgi:hypothetical protein